MRILVIALFSLLFGLAIGSTPFLQDHLHWNIWFVIPVSGVIFGTALGWLQFIGCYLLGVRVTFGLAIILSAIVAGAYFATDVGMYLTLKTSVMGSGIPIKIHDLLSFQDYMSYRLGDTTVESLRSHTTIEIGSTVHTISFIFDLIGAALGGFLGISILFPKYSFCEQCDTYKKHQRRYKIMPRLNDEGLNNLFLSIEQITQKKSIIHWLD
jgi:hypothetical protein